MTSPGGEKIVGSDTGPSDTGGKALDTVSTTKRALLKAGWVAPVILAVGLPRSGFATNISGTLGSTKDSPDPRSRPRDAG